jgi:hypothetical protein
LTHGRIAPIPLEPYHESRRHRINAWKDPTQRALMRAISNRKIDVSNVQSITGIKIYSALPNPLRHVSAEFMYQAIVQLQARDIQEHISLSWMENRYINNEQNFGQGPCPTANACIIVTSACDVPSFITVRSYYRRSGASHCNRVDREAASCHVRPVPSFTSTETP